MDDELSLPAEPRLEGRPNEKKIDLNLLFPDTETNLNDLFPDAEVKHLLKSITKNKKDMSAIKERLTNENETSDEDEEEALTDDDSFCSDQAKDNNMYEALNHGFKLAKGDIFAWINSDDFYYQNCLSKIISKI